jgi:hypothetical protein
MASNAASVAAPDSRRKCHSMMRKRDAKAPVAALGVEPEAEVGHRAIGDDRLDFGRMRGQQHTMDPALGEAEHSDAVAIDLRLRAHHFRRSARIRRLAPGKRIAPELAVEQPPVVDRDRQVAVPHEIARHALLVGGHAAAGRMHDHGRKRTGARRLRRLQMQAQRRV